MTNPQSNDFDYDDEFFMNEVTDDERDRSDSMVFIEADSIDKDSLTYKKEVASIPALSQRSTNEPHAEGSTSESDEDIIITSESMTVSGLANRGSSVSRRLRSETAKLASDNRSAPLLPATRSKRRKLTSNVRQPPPSNGKASSASSEKKKSARLGKSKDCENEEPQRLYNVKFLSRLDGSIGRIIEVKVLGDREFSSILESVLDGFVKECDGCEDLDKPHNADNVTLYWNNAKLLKFMTCDSLRIHRASEGEIVHIEITMVHREQEQEYEERLRSRLVGLGNGARSVLYDGTGLLANEVEDSKNQGMNKLIESSNTSSLKNLVSEDSEKESNSAAIKLALVGQDNKKLYVQVRPSTPFAKVADYYRSQKSLPATTQVKLMFDHEELDLNGTVVEQDMENGDMLEVLL
ncbi:hypothetical protein HG536_0E00910 [Torulaspora globosa]|uniref:Rad60/SUMO-like domain-containing protein n=1 Tax=Torulaspora globosa TaxID=48254 RepID=A0A7G3ZI44_9SACH|nr:uncharacterized protein HG536_0E00910 [Torulaspora globosa]QLL33180.1 hypothetical protein HG536_0E00910 [Torulaspora globosa]